jgi:uncharacterized protein
MAVAALAGLAILMGTLAASDSTTRVERQPLTIVTASGTTARLEVEIAQTAEERSVGLSGRDEVPMDTGMLFVFERRGPGFWMRDTTVPLSVAFVEDCGRIVEIKDMEPLSLEIHNTEHDYGFGLETAQGWFEANGVAVGDIVSLPRDLRPEHC